MTQLLNPPARAKELLAGLETNTIEPKDFYIRCVLWVLEPDIWSEIHVRYFPEAPEEWMQYESMDLKDKSKLDPSFFRQQVIADYLKIKDQVFCWNKGWMGWLKMALEWLPDTKEYLDQQLVLQKKYYDFKRWVDANAPKIIGFREDSREYKPRKIDTAAQSVAEMFGGSVL